MKLGVVLMNLGGPTSKQEVGAFLFRLFSDPDLIKLGGGLRQRLLAKLIVYFRAPKVAARYQRISQCATSCQGSKLCPSHPTGSPYCSPINPATEAQRRALQNSLSALLPQANPLVVTAMRYSSPATATALQLLAQAQVSHVVVLPLFPQFSYTTTGSSLQDWQRHKHQLNLTHKWQELTVRSYARQPLLLKAFSSRMDEALAAYPEEERASFHVVFSAHGTPLAEVAAGDPYTHEVRQTVEGIINLRPAGEAHWLGFQSRVGPAKWTQPNTIALAKRLVNYGLERLLLVPVAFVSDHIETLMELNIELREELASSGIAELVVTRGLNDHPLFIQALAAEVLTSLRIPQAQLNSVHA